MIKQMINAPSLRAARTELSISKCGFVFAFRRDGLYSGMLGTGVANGGPRSLADKR